MADYLKIFATQAEYDTWISGTYPEPNVSYIEATDEVKFTNYELAGEDMQPGMATYGPFSGTTLNSLNEYVVSVDIPEGVTEIGTESFYGCISLTSIDLPSTVTTIGDHSFSSCTSLTSIDLPSGVTSIANSAFSYCSALESVTVRATTPPTLGTNVFSNTSANLAIYVPSASVSAYQTAWSDYSSIITAITE